MVWLVPSKVTVPERAVNVPELAQLPATFKLKLEPETASNVPAVIVKFPDRKSVV